jgi:hypothetical protein
LQLLRLRQLTLLLLLQQVQLVLLQVKRLQQQAQLLLQQVQQQQQHQQHLLQHLLLLLHLVQHKQQVTPPQSPQVLVGISYQTMGQPPHGLTSQIGEQSNAICISTP